MKASSKRVCAWAGDDPLMRRYHDEEWGAPVHDDRVLFEFLTLEGAQAGLSWSIILRKRETYREAFAGFDPARIARFDARRRTLLLKNPGIVRNRLKIESTVSNARAFLEVRKEFGSFDSYAWRFVNGKPIQNHRSALNEIPARTPESDALSQDLRERGFRFVGSTIMYAFMQAVGMVNDHEVSCYRHRELAGGRRPSRRSTAAASTSRVVVKNVNHPGKSRSVGAAHYQAMRRALLKVLPRRSPGLTFAGMLRAVLPHLPADTFPGGTKAGWWAKTVQLDLEAKGVITREKTTPLRFHRS